MGALRHKKQELRCLGNTRGSLLLALRFTHYERKTRLLVAYKKYDISQLFFFPFERHL